MQYIAKFARSSEGSKVNLIEFIPIVQLFTDPCAANRSMYINKDELRPLQELTCHTFLHKLCIFSLESSDLL